jgi:hypothetical protein
MKTQDLLLLEPIPVIGRCPGCGKEELFVLHKKATQCGCSGCHRVFRYIAGWILPDTAEEKQPKA